MTVVYGELTSGAGGTLPSAAAAVPRPSPGRNRPRQPLRDRRLSPGSPAAIAASPRAAAAGSAGAAFPPRDAPEPAATSPAGRGSPGRGGPRRRAEGAQWSGSRRGPGEDPSATITGPRPPRRGPVPHSPACRPPWRRLRPRKR